MNCSGGRTAKVVGYLADLTMVQPQAPMMAQPSASTSDISVQSTPYPDRVQDETQTLWRNNASVLTGVKVADASKAHGKQVSGFVSIPHHGASLKRKLSERVGKKERQNSLRHVKNSTEVLRQRSAQTGAGTITPDGGSGGREGRQFTVGNVGNNGIIYLRYVLDF